MKGNGKKVGYIRVSTDDQNPDRQLYEIELDRKFIDYASGKNLKRPELNALLDYVREDDVVIVHSMDRLARNVKELLGLIDVLNSRGVEVHFIKENMKFTGSDDHMSRLILTVIGAIAEFERQQILERQREGIAQAKILGKYKGGTSKMTPEIIDKIKEKFNSRKTKSKIAEEMGMSRCTLYRYLDKINKDEMLIKCQP